ncbi:MAG: deoxyribonuclease V [Nitrospirota bacterium]|nr:deoxyribonuclease V [Nitrospirota bacterium]
MQVYGFHPWDVTPREAMRIQEQVRARVIPRGRLGVPRLVAGADLAYDTDAHTVFASVVVLRFPGLEVVEAIALKEQISFPYIPGLLSFRETPPLLRAFARLRHEPDLIFVDGHGRSHPRSAGLACHIGVLLDRPVIGCAKSVLVGTYQDPALSRGSVSYLYNGRGQVLGGVLRTRDKVKPVFVSIGHRIGLAQAIKLTLACAQRFRVPEPTRQADCLAARAKRERRAFKIPA